MQYILKLFLFIGENKINYMKILYVNPWVGEFGWEVAWWSPLIRGIAQKYEKVIIACRFNTIHLYEYATEIVKISACAHNTYQGKLLSKMPVDWGKNGDIVCPTLLYKKYNIRPTISIYKDLSLNIISNHNVDIMCAFRIGKDKKEYPIELCDILVNLLISSGYTVGCFGDPNNYCPDGIIDLRTQSLKEQCAILGNAKCAIGHSSGTIHLASFCKCPHITWHVDKPWLNAKTLINRYNKYWNPFNTLMKYMPTGIPAPEDVIKEIQKLIGEKNNG